MTMFLLTKWIPIFYILLLSHDLRLDPILADAHVILIRNKNASRNVDQEKLAAKNILENDTVAMDENFINCTFTVENGTNISTCWNYTLANGTIPDQTKFFFLVNIIPILIQVAQIITRIVLFALKIAKAIMKLIKIVMRLIFKAVKIALKFGKIIGKWVIKAGKMIMKSFGKDLIQAIPEMISTGIDVHNSMKDYYAMQAESDRSKEAAEKYRLADLANHKQQWADEGFEGSGDVGEVSEWEPIKKTSFLWGEEDLDAGLPGPVIAAIVITLIFLIVATPTAAFIITTRREVRRRRRRRRRQGGRRGTRKSTSKCTSKATSKFKPSFKSAGFGVTKKKTSKSIPTFKSKPTLKSAGSGVTKKKTSKVSCVPKKGQKMKCESGK